MLQTNDCRYGINLTWLALLASVQIQTDVNDVGRVPRVIVESVTRFSLTYANSLHAMFGFEACHINYIRRVLNADLCEYSMVTASPCAAQCRPSEGMKFMKYFIG